MSPALRNSDESHCIVKSRKTLFRTAKLCPHALFFESSPPILRPSSTSYRYETSDQPVSARKEAVMKKTSPFSVVLFLFALTVAAFGQNYAAGAGVAIKSKAFAEERAFWTRTRLGSGRMGNVTPCCI